MESKTKDRHRQVECGICNKVMRSDNLKRHKKVCKVAKFSTDNLLLPEKIVSKKPKSTEKIDNVRARCLQNQKLYIEKIKIGEQVANMIKNDEVMYEALEKKYREAFNTYQKYLKAENHDSSTHN